MDRREAWLLREAARKRANVMGLHEWAEDIAQETVLRLSLSVIPVTGDQCFVESVLHIVEKSEAVPALSVHFH